NTDLLILYAGGRLHLHRKMHQLEDDGPQHVVFMLIIGVELFKDALIKSPRLFYLLIRQLIHMIPAGFKYRVITQVCKSMEKILIKYAEQTSFYVFLIHPGTGDQRTCKAECLFFYPNRFISK